MSSPRVTVLVRPGCHLCEDALDVVHRVAGGLGEQVEVVDIDAAGEKDLLDRHSEQVPVVLVDGRMHDFWRVDPDRLTRALTGAT